MVAESQLSGLVHPMMCSPFERAVRAVWGWLRGLVVTKPATNASESESGEARAVSVPTPTDSGVAVERASGEAQPKDKVPV